MNKGLRIMKQLIDEALLQHIRGERPRQLSLFPLGPHETASFQDWIIYNVQKVFNEDWDKFFGIEATYIPHLRRLNEKQWKDTGLMMVDPKLYERKEGCPIPKDEEDD
jgi:hypothetical protein